MKQAEGLKQRLSSAGVDMPVFVGMRNWHPLLPDTLKQMADAGVKRAIGFISAAQRSYSSCTQYQPERRRCEDRNGAGTGCPTWRSTYVEDWHEHDGFIEANARHVQRRSPLCPRPCDDRARLVFTAHSIPVSMTGRGAVPAAVAAILTARRGASRAKRLGARLPEPQRPARRSVARPRHQRIPARRARQRARWRSCICPIGFVCDHIEVLYDLDEEAAQVCRELGLPMARAQAVNDDPAVPRPDGRRGAEDLAALRARSYRCRWPLREPSGWKDLRPQGGPE